MVRAAHAQLKSVEEDAPLNAILELQPACGATGTVLRINTAIERHLAGTHYFWRGEQGGQVAAKKYLAGKLGRHDEEGELGRRLKFLDALKKEMVVVVVVEMKKCEEKVKQVHKKFIEKYTVKPLVLKKLGYDPSYGTSDT